jgi:hypothetical protein
MRLQDRTGNRLRGRHGLDPEDPARAKEWFYRLLGTVTAAALTGAALLAALGVVASS